jgi:hypothetical protein
MEHFNLNHKMMNLLDYTNTWVKGEVFQGKVMLVIGVIVLIAAIAILRSDNSLLRGTLFPLGFIILIFFGYGGFQTFSRPSHINKVTEVYNENPEKAIEQELAKAQKDDRSYRNLKIVWSILIVLASLLFIIFSKDYFKGVSTGLIALFLTTLVVDSTLHYRLKIYLEQLQKLIN